MAWKLFASAVGSGARLCLTIIQTDGLSLKSFQTKQFTHNHWNIIGCSLAGEKVIWNILFGDEVVDACNLRRDAKIWCDKWNKILAEEAATGV